MVGDSQGRHFSGGRNRNFGRAAGALAFAALVVAPGCGGTRWMRVEDTARELRIDTTDCRMISQKMSVERNDYTSSYRMGFFKFNEEKKVSKNAIQEYFNECMYQRGWNRSAGFKQAPANASIHEGTYVLLDLSVAEEETAISEGKGFFYRIGARQLSPDIEVRLLGRKAGDHVEFVRAPLATANISKRRKNQNTPKVDEAPQAKLTIKVDVKELFEAD